MDDLILYVTLHDLMTTLYSLYSITVEKIIGYNFTRFTCNELQIAQEENRSRIKSIINKQIRFHSSIFCNCYQMP